MAWKERKTLAVAALILGIACIISSVSTMVVGQVGETLLEEDFETYRTWPEDPPGVPVIPEVPDCTGYPDEAKAIETFAIERDEWEPDWLREGAEWFEAPTGWRFDVDYQFALCGIYTEPSSWQLIDECQLFGMEGLFMNSGSHEDKLFPFASTIQAAYVGFVDPNTGTCSYKGDDANIISSRLRSPEVKLEAEGGFMCDYLGITFDYWRQVESYGSIPEDLDAYGVPAEAEDRNFDQTWVAVVFSDTLIPIDSYDPHEPCQPEPDEYQYESTIIWYKDSGWPSLEKWIQAGPLSIERPAWAKYAWLEFHFEVVDNFNNDYVGWFIDNVRIDCLDDLPQICWDEDTPTTLEQAYVGHGYHVQLDEYVSEYGSDRAMRFFLAEAGGGNCDCGYGDCQRLTDPDSPLPEGMTLSSDGILSARTFTERMVGTYNFWVLVEGESVRGENCACHEFQLVVRGEGTSSGAIYESDLGAYPSEWYRCGDATDCDVNLWKETSGISGMLIPNPNGIMEPQPALYFGNFAAGGASYDTGQRVHGCYCIDLTSYLCCSESIGTEVEVGFKQWRDVESYAGGAYDKTWVEISVDGQTWIPIKSEVSDDLYWDSGDPSSTAWEWIQLKTGVLITEAKRLLLRFCFDSVDGFDNDHLGWVVDEITVWLGEPALALENCMCVDGDCALPVGFVSEPYNVQLMYTGGIPVRSGARVEGLPLGLECDGQRIYGTPRVEGTYPVTITVPQASPEACTLTIKPERCFFLEGFEGEWAWQPSGRMWQQVCAADFTGAQPPCDLDSVGEALTGNHVAYFGEVPQAEYYAGQAASSGTLTLPDPFEGITANSFILLSFDSCRQVEQNTKNGYDQTIVQVAFGGSRDEEPGEWITVWYKDSSDPNSTEWEHEVANHGVAFLVPQDASKMWVRLVFDSVDRWYNHYFGWMVDNLWICYADEGGPIAPESSYKSAAGVVRRSGVDELSVMNVPNPVTDVHTTTFTVRGEGVEAIKIQIFDQNETLVFQRQVEGQELEWHTDNNYGEYLANGTYYYRAFARVEGEWIPTRFEKLVILR